MEQAQDTRQATGNRVFMKMLSTNNGLVVTFFRFSRCPERARQVKTSEITPYRQQVG